MALVIKNPPANAGGDTRDMGAIPGLGRFPGGGNGNPLQYSCPEKPMDRGAWLATVHRVAKSWMRCSNLAYIQHLQEHLCMRQGDPPSPTLAGPWPLQLGKSECEGCCVPVISAATAPVSLMLLWGSPSVHSGELRLQKPCSVHSSQMSTVLEHFL